MKVVNEIINHLFYKKVITEEALEALKAKGYYSDFDDERESYLSEWDYWELDYAEMDRLLEKSIEDEEALSLENELANKRKRKQGKKAMFKEAKKRHKNNKKISEFVNNHIHKNLTYTCYDGFFFDEGVLDKIKQQPVRDVDRLYGLRHKYYEKCYMFWDDLAKMIGEEQIIKYNNQLIKIFSEFNQIEGGIENQPEKKLIQPAAFFMLKKEEFIHNSKGWELILKIDEKEILITNAEGELKN